MRLVNLWWPLKHDGPDVGPYAEYSGGSFAAPEWLALSLDYRVQGLSSDAGLSLGGHRRQSKLAAIVHAYAAG